MIKQLMTGLGIALLAGLTPAATAALINGDFQPATGVKPANYATGAAVVGAAGDIWNSLGGKTATGVALVDSSGASTGVTITWNGTGNWTNNADSTPNPGLMIDYLYVSNKNTGMATISGLAPQADYELYVYSQSQNNLGRTATFTVNGLSQDIAPNKNTTFVSGQNYGLFNAVADAGGNLNITWAAAAGATGDLDFNGFQLVTPAVPEPASLAIGVVGGGLLLLLRRRRRA